MGDMFNNFLGISALAHTGRLTWLELTHLTTLLLRFGVSIMTNEESHVVTKRAIRNLCCLSSIFFSKIAALLGMGEDTWPLVRNKLIKELDRWLHDYINLFGSTKRFEQLRLSHDYINLFGGTERFK